jgi:ketosteroid isomerase-like protein
MMTTQKSQANDEVLIRQLRDDLTNALRAKNAAGVVSQFAADTVMFLLAPPLQYKTGENASGQPGMQEWFDSFDGAIGYEVRDLSITTGADVAFCHSLNRLSGIKKDGEKIDLWLRETLGLRKIDGAWKITHQHQSVPFYMDGSYKAAVDLRP